MQSVVVVVQKYNCQNQDDGDGDGENGKNTEILTQNWQNIVIGLVMDSELVNV